MRFRMQKKGQEEMVGFVLIMVIVAIIFLVFLSFFIGRGKEAKAGESAEVSQFLDSLVEYTTECSLDGGYFYKNVENLVKDCNKGLRCSSGEMACEVLNETVKEAIEASWNFGPDNPKKGYHFTASSEPSAGVLDPLIDEINGDKRVNRVGADRTIHVPGGNVIISLELYL